MLRFRQVTFFALMLVVFVSCQEKHAPTDLGKNDVIPQPLSVQATGGVFTLSERTMVVYEGDAAIESIAKYLAFHLRPATGFPLAVESGEPMSGAILLSLQEDASMGEEGYKLTVSEESISLVANKAAGLFRGVQTIRQLLPVSIEKDSKQNGPWEIATGTISDAPVYGYRGSMLDVSRHFFGVEDVKRYIDFLAYYKFNVLHLGLTNDQGWRIEIKSWPNLATHGGSTEVGGEEGGYYTQEQYRELVAYAQERYITIVPEIDMPGHTNAALASYAELNCDGKARELYTGTDVGFSTFCTDKEITYKFVDDVFRELAAITPGPYLHIGGDESHSTKKEDYIYFVNRVQDIVSAHGKEMIGWDEVATAALKPSSIAQVWASEENAQAAVSQGAKILMSPARKTYMDMQYDSTTRLGLHWAAYIEVDSAYMWDPATLIPGVTRENILGIEAPLWTETISTMDDIEYMIFPRLTGYAEIGWLPANKRDWAAYKSRLAEHSKRFDAMGIDYYKSPKVEWDQPAAAGE